MIKHHLKIERKIITYVYVLYFQYLLLQRRSTTTPQIQQCRGSRLREFLRRQPIQPQDLQQISRKKREKYLK